MIEDESIIYTNYEWTLNNIKEAYYGWVYFYSNYITTKGQDINDVMGMNKHAIRFITFTSNDYKDFTREKKDNKLQIAEVNLIMLLYEKIEKEINLTKDEYILINSFFAKYIKICGLGDIVKQKDDINKRYYVCDF
jgi:hypothetical protein